MRVQERKDPFVGGALLLGVDLRGRVYRDQGDQCGFTRCRTRGLAVIVGQPLRIVGELGEASLKPVIFTRLVSAARYPQQFGILNRFRAALFSGEHIFLFQKK